MGRDWMERRGVGWGRVEVGSGEVGWGGDGFGI